MTAHEPPGVIPSSFPHLNRFYLKPSFFTFALPILSPSLLRGGVSKWLDGCPVVGEGQPTASGRSFRMQKVQES